MLSLFDHLGSPAGSKLGAQVYKEAKDKNIDVETRLISTRNYKGEVMLYPETFLLEYFTNIKK